MTPSQQPLCRDAMRSSRPLPSPDAVKTMPSRRARPSLISPRVTAEANAGGRVLGMAKFLLEVERCGLSHKGKAEVGVRWARANWLGLFFHRFGLGGRSGGGEF